MTMATLNDSARFGAVTFLSSGRLYVCDSDALADSSFRSLTRDLLSARVTPVVLIRYNDPNVEALSNQCNELGVIPFRLAPQETGGDFIRSVADHVEISGCLASPSDSTLADETVHAGGVVVRGSYRKTTPTLDSLFGTNYGKNSSFEALVSGNAMTQGPVMTDEHRLQQRIGGF